MKINRENNKNDSVDISFRYVILLEQQAKEVCTLLDKKPFEYEYFAPSKRKKSYVITINIEKYFEEKYIKKINQKLKIPTDQYGFWFSIDSEYDYGGISLPENIVEYIKQIGGKVDFSYVISIE